ncbi:MAG: prepilin-type N-terminal cleavage/methylation domain-containing protein [Desulfobacterales bacterium]|jgi:type IV pilus assembly protein PilW
MKLNQTGNKPNPSCGTVRQKERGFTMVEMLVSLAMFAIIVAAVGAVMVPMRRSYTTQDVAAGAQQTTRLAIDFMVNDIRLAGLDPIGEADAGIEDATALFLQFTIDRAPAGGEANGEIDEGELERLTYAWDAPTRRLRLTYDEGTGSSDTETLVDNVSNLRFTYFDEEDNVTTDLNEIRSVAITMTVEEPAGLEGTVARTYNTRVRCRNLGI